jgi:c(7)-type cytochrome triheme protein
MFESRQNNGVLKPRFAVIAVVAAVLLAPSALTAPGDLVFPRDEAAGIGGLPPSVFPHWLHRTRYRCDSCHNDLFEMQLGASEISMELIGKGESCGACHNGQQAFAVSFKNCTRCHVSAEN